MRFDLKVTGDAKSHGMGAQGDSCGVSTWIVRPASHCGVSCGVSTGGWRVKGNLTSDGLESFAAQKEDHTSRDCRARKGLQVGE